MIGWRRDWGFPLGGVACERAWPEPSATDGAPVSFIETIERAAALLQASGRLSLRALRREFGLDEEALEDLVEELVEVRQVAVREGRVLVWMAEAADAPPHTGRAADEPREGTRNVMECVLDAGVARVVHVSTALTCGCPRGPDAQVRSLQARLDCS
jgi:nucleoside-diphosphate-sugar epimerase